jgi:hypothetical protein
MRYVYDRPINIYCGCGDDPCNNSNQYKLLAKITYDESYYDENGCYKIGSTRVYFWYGNKKPDLDELLEYIRKEWDTDEAEQIIPQMKKIYEEE